MRILLVALVIGWLNAEASSDLMKWSQGIIVMADGQVRQGELAFEFSEVVLFRASSEVSVFPAIKVQSFRYYDQEANINRKFESRTVSAGKRASFYEIVVCGEVGVVRKLKARMLPHQVKSDKDDYDYFISFHDDLILLKHFRSKVYPTLIASSSQTQLIINEHRLNPNHGADAIQIIQIYNKETSAETLVAGI